MKHNLISTNDASKLIKQAPHYNFFTNWNRTRNVEALNGILPHNVQQNHVDNNVSNLWLKKGALSVDGHKYKKP